MTRTISALAIVGNLMLAALSAPAFAGDMRHFVGNWVLNTAKSTFEPGPAPQSMRIVTTDAGKGNVTSAIVRMTADGAKIEEVTTYASDGKEYAPSLMSPPVAPPITFVVTQADPHTIWIETRSGGKAISMTRATISADGKTQTGMTTGIAHDGKQVSNTMVFDKK